MRAGTNPSPRIIATSALDRLYQIDTPEALKDCLTTFLTAVKDSFRTLSNKEEDGIITRVTTSEEALSSELYQRYCRNFNRAVDAVPIEDKDLSELWHSNVSRFSAYKAYQVTQELRRWAMEEEGDMAILRAVLHKYSRYQAAEYNTAVARARTGKQWQQFDEPDNRRLFPCIKWLPSRSASPREEHLPFYNRVWPKDDPFWTSNQPGTLWNCKCDWEQTDEEPTGGNPSGRIVKPGLDQNPATSGQIFTDTAPYIKGTTSEAKDIVEGFFRPIAEHHKEFLTYRDNPDYHDVEFSWDNGGLKATHDGHISHDNPNEQKYFKEQLSATQLETECQNILFGSGRSAILLEEIAKAANGDILPALDMQMNGRLMDIRSITENNRHTIRNVLNKKNDQIRRFYNKTGQSSDTVCLYFHDASMYSVEKVKNGIKEYLGQTKSNNNIQHIVLSLIHI